MAQTEKDEERERRIHEEVIVDAYNEAEQAMGWYYYLEDRLNSAFIARCIKMRIISPLQVGDEVDVIGLAPEDECEHEMFVIMRWDRPEGLAVPLSQLGFVHGDERAREAVEDWHYWVNRGYEL